jgi:hypothetical protein
MTIEQRPTLERRHGPDVDREFRHVCKCGYIGQMYGVIVPLPGVCPVLAALQARMLGIADTARADQRERYERPRRLWVPLEP